MIYNYLFIGIAVILGILIIGFVWYYSLKAIMNAIDKIAEQNGQYSVKRGRK